MSITNKDFLFINANIFVSVHKVIDEKNSFGERKQNHIIYGIKWFLEFKEQNASKLTFIFK